jgi:hypothetical protein
MKKKLFSIIKLYNGNILKIIYIVIYKDIN